MTAIIGFVYPPVPQWRVFKTISDYAKNIELKYNHKNTHTQKIQNSYFF